MPIPTPLLLAAAAAAAAIPAAAAAWLIARHAALEGSAAVAADSEGVRRLQEALAHEQGKRAAERAGRIKAEQKLKQLGLQAATAAVTAGGGGSGEQQAQPGLQAYPFAPIGVLQSCFNDRRGTPRQPHLVPAARSVLRLAPGIPPACLQGLSQFSHCWVLYVFHQNTDLAKHLAARTAGSGQAPAHSHTKALVAVPRLNGGKLGVFATRTPHRPVPIGLSTAQVLEVDAAAGRVVLGGVDIVDGSPVLDIKPYVPFSDALHEATAPDWVKAAAEAQEPLALSGVSITAAAQRALADAWAAVHRRKQALCSSPQHLTELVQQVLGRDIRSLHQRTSVAPVQQQQPQQQPQQPEGPQYTVTLDSVQVSYSIDPGTGAVTVADAQPLLGAAPS